MPHASTWSRLLAEAVDVSALELALGRFFQVSQVTDEVSARGSIILAVDGKTFTQRVPGTISAGQTSGVHFVAAYLLDHGVVLAQLAVVRRRRSTLRVAYQHTLLLSLLSQPSCIKDRQAPTS